MNDMLTLIYNNGLLYLFGLCCAWPVVVHFGIVLAPRIWRWIGRHMPERQ